MQFLSFGLVSSVAIAIVLIVVLTKAVKFVSAKPRLCR